MEQEYRFCHRCGNRLQHELVNEENRPQCSSCGFVVYFDPKLAAVILVSNGDGLLLVRRDIEPMLGRWSFPSGYVDRGEMVEQAAIREVREETNLDVEITGLVGLFSSNGYPVALAAFFARVIGGCLIAGPETQDVRFFPINDLPDLPFPLDYQIFDAWNKRMKDL